MRAIRCLLAAALAAGIVTVVVAQPGGGFGGGGGGDVNTLVFTNAALQEEIKLTAAQKEKMKPVADKQAEIAKSMRDAFSGGKFDKEKFTEIREKAEKVAEESKKVIDDTLTADQKKRLKQISIQVMGFTAFGDPEAKGGKGGFGGPSEAQKAIMKEVGETMKFTDKQKTAIKGIADEFNKESREIRTEAGIGGGKGGKGKAPDAEKAEAANKKIDKLRKEAWTKVEGELDATQKTAWKGLVGEAFDTSKLRPAPPPKKD